MKPIFSFGILFFAAMGLAQAQQEVPRQTQLEIGFGVILPQLNAGIELMRSAELRDKGLSYFQSSDGNRRQVGDYNNLIGQTIHLGYYKPVGFAKGLMLGALARYALTGTRPAQGGEPEAYYLNFITTGFAAKHYIMDADNFFIKTDVGVASVFTKNRFLNELNEQNFFHQFGIGGALNLETGFTFPISKSKPTFVEVKTGYQFMNTRVEVDGIGDDMWRFGAILFAASLIF
jgi:hypothetical protein